MVRRRLSKAVLGGLGIAAVTWWWRKKAPSACPYSMRFVLWMPRPGIRRGRLRDLLGPARGDRILEIGPGNGHYTLGLSEWVGPDGTVDIFDIQQRFLDHTLRRAEEHGLTNVRATCGDAQSLPFDTASFDAVVLITVLGEIPDGDSALGEIARVLKPNGLLVIGEAIPDPDFTPYPRVQQRAAGAGLHHRSRSGTPIGYLASFSPRPAVVSHSPVSGN